MDTPITKACFKCGETKQLSDFYKHPRMGDGHVNKCKECNKQDVRENRKKREDYYNAYDRLRNTEDHRKEYNKRNESKPERQAKIKAYKHEWNKRYDAKKKAATAAVSNALRDGKIEKWPCWVCGTTESVEGHHPNYDAPLDVIWLCTKHHAEVHREHVHEQDRILLETTEKGSRWKQRD